MATAAAAAALRRLARLVEGSPAGRRESSTASSPEDSNDAGDGDKTEEKPKSEETATKEEADSDTSESEDEEEEDDEGPPSVPQWFADSKKKYKALDSFHTLFMREDYKEVLMKVRLISFDIPFFHQLTFIGNEGNLPDMVDVTPKANGFQFRWAPNSKDVQLTELQQRLPATDLASSLYSAETGGALAGYLRIFAPVAVDKVGAQDKGKTKVSNAADADDAAPTDAAGGAAPPTPPEVEPEEEPGARCLKQGGKKGGAAEHHQAAKGSKKAGRGDKGAKKAKSKKKKVEPAKPGEEAVLIDVTHWLRAFALSAAEGQGISGMLGGRRGRGGHDQEAHLLEARAFPQNFWLRYTVQNKGDGPVKQRSDATAYYSVAFCRLPEVPMVPRDKDRRVGFFETRLLVGGGRRANEATNVINRWNLERRGGQLTYHIDPGVPELFRETVRRGVESWNVAFRAAGCGDRAVRCLAPGDEDFPADYSRGDARYSAIYMTDSLLPVYGYGPSLTDFRTGEILVAHVLLGFSVFVHEGSRHAPEALSQAKVKGTGGNRPPLVDADHENVLSNLLFTVMHEVGHTLGLRHNFLAQEDGNSSVMMYPDTLDTLHDSSRPRFGGHFPSAPGRYDIFAIKYGYSHLEHEARGLRHPALDLLANGQDVADGVLSVEPLNPLFATDEDVGLDDPRVNRWNNAVASCGYDKFEHALAERRRLLELVRSGSIFPESFASRVQSDYAVALRHVLDGLRLLGGSHLDVTRRRYTAVDGAAALTALQATVDFCVGPVGRFSVEENQYMMRAFPRNGYQVSRLYMLRMHKDSVRSLLGAVLSQSRLEHLEMQRAALQEQPAGGSLLPPSAAPALGTFDVLSTLAFDAGRYAPGLFHPFQRPPASGSEEADSFSPPAARALAAAAGDALRAEAVLALARLVHDLAYDEDVLAVVQAGARAFVDEAAEMLRAAAKSSGRGTDAVTKAFWGTVLEELTRPPDRDRGAGAGLFPFMLFGAEDDVDDFDDELVRPGGGILWGQQMSSTQGLAARGRRGRRRQPLVGAWHGGPSWSLCSRDCCRIARLPDGAPPVGRARL